MSEYGDVSLSIVSTVKERSNFFNGPHVELSLKSEPIPRPEKDQILVRVEASPINPSDLGTFLAGMDLGTAVASEDNVGNPVIRGGLTRPAFEAARARDGVAMPVGNEGAGVVSAVGIDSCEEAMDLLGKTVAILGGSMYSQYRVVNWKQAVPMESGTTSMEAASAFVNPLTVLGMVETMKDEGHTAIVHTAAASQLGQMLVRTCADEGIPLVNVVRRPEQISLLASLGAEHIVDSSSDEFHDDLVNAISASGATLGFDATGGGELTSQILAAMEVAANRAAGGAKPGQRYGSDTFKQVYIYGGLDTSETRLNRSYGMRWGVGGWLLGPNFLDRIGPERTAEVKQKVAAEITTTFSTSYGSEISLREALSLEKLHEYQAKGTLAKHLITPHKMDDAQRQAAKDLLDLAGTMARI